MKRRVFIGVMALLTVVTVGAWPYVVHWRNETAFADVPQSERPLRVPTQQLLNSVFPDGTKQILEQSQRFELLSLDPSPDDYDAPISAPPRPLFHHHAALGQTVVADAATKASLLASLYDGFVPPHNGLKQVGLGCFMPRHGIRATRDGKTVDLLICFSCQNMEVYRDARLLRRAHIMAAPRPTFDQILTQANIPISR